MITYFNSFAENWMAYFGTAILQNTLFLGVIFLVLYLLRERDARIRYAVAALGLIKLLVPPFVPLTVRIVTSTATSVGTIEMGNMTVGVASEAAPVVPVISFLGILFLIWAATVIVMFGSTLFSTLRLKWHLRDSSFIKHVEIDGRAVDIYCSPNISVPLSIGLFPKRVYVPALWSSLTDELQHSLLRHEVAHIKRKDGLLGALQMLARAIYFFHPLVWILTRQADELREMACDDMAVDNSEVTPLVYSRCLVHVAEHMLPSWSCSSASTLMKQKNKLYHRVNYQVKETDMKKIPKHRSRLIWTLLLVMVVPLSWYCKQPDSAVGLKDGKTGKIYGMVTAVETGEPIAGANIILLNTPQGAASNERGEYIISNIKPGTHSLKCSVMGRAETTINFLKVSEGKSLEQNFTMFAQPLEYNNVIISNKPPVAAKPAKGALPLPPGNQAGPATPAMPSVQAPPDELIEFDNAPAPVGGFQAIYTTIVYPESAKKAGVEGKVTVSIFINKYGDVTDYKIQETSTVMTDNKSFIPDTKSIEDLEKAAINALSSTKWVPATKDSKPIGVWITVPVKFALKTTKATEEFVPYDTPPELINGALAVQSNLVYPEKAKQANEQGTVLVQVKIDKNGDVEKAEILKSFGSELCDEAALKAMMLTKWTPAKQRDKAVSVWMTLPIEFKLDDEK